MFSNPWSAAPRIPAMPSGLAFIMWHAPGLAGVAAAGAAAQATAATVLVNTSEIIAIRLRNISYVVTYHAQPGGGTPAIARAGEWCRDWTPQMREVDARTWHQDGLTPTWGARKVSDNLSRREFRRLELYDVSRLLGIEFMMRLWLDPDGADGARLEFDREEKDFDERDRAVLDLLLPHLARLRRQAAGRARDRASEAEQLTAREREILGLVAKGRTNIEVAKLLWISPGTVRKHLENAYEKLGVHTRTAAVAAAFGRREDD